MLSAQIQRRAGFLVLSLAALALRVQPSEAQPKMVAASQPSDLILGEWWTENRQGRLLFTRDKAGLFRGTTTCCVHKNDEDNPDIDIHNPRPNLRSRPTLGIVLIWKLKYEDGEYVDGYVYNPRDGKTYRIEAKVLDHETLKIRGYMGISLFGQNQIWKRAHPPAPRPAAAH
jgi:uncharacterized protein (DUF2147 family)